MLPLPPSLLPKLPLFHDSPAPESSEVERACWFLSLPALFAAWPKRFLVPEAELLAGSRMLQAQAIRERQMSCGNAMGGSV